MKNKMYNMSDNKILNCMEETNINTAIVTILTTVISKKLNLDITMYSVLVTIVNFFVSKISLVHINLSNILWFHYIGITCILLICYMIYYNFERIRIKFLSILNHDYTVLHIITSNMQDNFLIYYNKYNHFYERNTDVILRDGAEPGILQPSDNIKIKFNDLNFKVKGYFIINKIDSKQQKNKENNKSLIDICLYIETKTCDNVLTYIESIIKENDKIALETNILYYYKAYRDSENKSSFIQKTMTNISDATDSRLEELFMNTFFHPLKNVLYKQAKLVNDNFLFFIENSQPAQMNILLYGPPGTGKSNYAYRLAHVLRRNIVSMDMLSINDSIEIKRTFNGKYSPVKKTVFVLDEFDITVATLYEREQNRKKREENLFSQQNKQQNKQQTNVNENNMFGLRDLLEILQGPIPNSGAIIIATTNKYEIIKSMCPELFRPGRLTPYYFGYFDIATLKEVIQYHFNEKCNFDRKITKVNACPAEIMLKIVEAKSDSEKGYKFFKSYIKSIVS